MYRKTLAYFECPDKNHILLKLRLRYTVWLPAPKNNILSYTKIWPCPDFTNKKSSPRLSLKGSDKDERKKKKLVLKWGYLSTMIQPSSFFSREWPISIHFLTYRRHPCSKVRMCNTGKDAIFCEISLSIFSRIISPSSPPPTLFYSQPYLSGKKKSDTCRSTLTSSPTKNIYFQ